MMICICINSLCSRVNPIFSEVDDHHVENHHQPPKHKQLHQDHHQELLHPERSKPAKKHNFYIPESYSSGYWSFNDGKRDLIISFTHVY